MVFPLNRRFHDVHVALACCIIIGDVLESPRLLRVAPAGSVVTGKGLEGANLMPPGTQVWGCVRSTEAADVCTDQSDAEHVHLHDADYTFLEVDNISMVVTQPLGAVLTHSSEGTSGDDHRSLLVFLEPKA